METIVTFAEAPFGYRVCLNRECPKADSCLRQLIEKSVPAELSLLTIVNPKHLATLKEACPYYRSSQKVSYAKGFIQLLGNLPYNQMNNVVNKLKSCFSHRTYFRIRKGERLLSPQEQEEVLKIIRSCGVTTPQKFDAYIMDYDW